MKVMTVFGAGAWVCDVFNEISYVIMTKEVARGGSDPLLLVLTRSLC